MVEEISSNNKSPEPSPWYKSIWEWFIGPYDSDICHIRGVCGLF